MSHSLLNILIAPPLLRPFHAGSRAPVRAAVSTKSTLIQLLCAMSLLDQMWDETVAGPRPDNGLGKLRKHSAFSFRASSGKESNGGNVRSYGDDAPEEAKRVTRSIMIVKPPGYSSPPVSPAGSTTPVSPFSGSRESFRFRRRSTSDAYEKASETGPRTPTSSYGV